MDALQQATEAAETVELPVPLPPEAVAELAALAAVHMGGNVGAMAAVLLVRQLRPTEFAA